MSFGLEYEKKKLGKVTKEQKMNEVTDFVGTGTNYSTLLRSPSNSWCSFEVHALWKFVESHPMQQISLGKVSLESNWMQCTFEKFATISTHSTKIKFLSKNWLG